MSSDWVLVTNQFLDNGCEIMLVDSFFHRGEKKNHWVKTLKIAAVAVYYGIKMLT